MITVIVSWKLTAGMTREELVAKYREGLPVWSAMPNLRRKTYVFDAKTKRCGAVYVWADMESAKKAYGPEFHERILRLYGAKPKIEFLETPFVIDNDGRTVVGEGL
jgi:hypothetical protein